MLTKIYYNVFCPFYLFFNCFTINVKVFAVFRYLYFTFYFDFVFITKFDINQYKIFKMTFMNIANSSITIYFLNFIKVEAAIYKQF